VSANILFSIVIPVKNGDIWLERLMESLVQQTLFPQSEIIVIDSGSTDRSLEIIARYPVRLIRIPPAEFNHGLTRNLGVREAKGEYVVMTVQDAVPAAANYLELLLGGFTSERVAGDQGARDRAAGDPVASDRVAGDRVAGVCGQQVVPHEGDKNPVLWFRPVSGHRTWYCHYDEPAEFLRLSPAEQREAVAWDNVTAAYRRSVLLENPFPEVDFAEDLAWARMMLLKGYTLGFVSGALVYHYHHQTPEFILPRYFSVFYYEFKLFGLKPVLRHSVLRHVLIAGKILVKEPKLSWGEKMRWFVFNVRYWRVLKETIRRFNEAVVGGDESLEAAYREICKKPPQAIKY
jgi:rhamnosyltransferase